MWEKATGRLHALLRWSERYTKTDMVYLASGAFWLGLSQTMVMAVGFIVSVLFGHFAAQDTYGNYRYVLVLAGLFGAVSLTGLPVGVTQSVARGFEGALRQGFYMNLKWSAGLVLLSLLASAYYLFVAHNTFLAAACVIIAGFAPLLNSANLFDSFLSGKRQFKRQAIYDIVDAIVPATVVGLAIVFSSRAILIILIYYVANTLSSLFFYARTRRLAKNDVEDPELLRFGGQMSFLNLLSVIADKIDSIIVFSLLGPANLAVYAFAALLPEQIKTFAKLLIPLYTPKLAERNISDIRLTLQHRLLQLFGLGAVVVVLYILAAPLLFKILFPVYLESVPFTQLYAIATLVTLLWVPFTAIFQSHRRTKELYLMNNVSSVFLLAALPILTYQFGIGGAIISEILYRLLGAVVAIYLFFRIPVSSR